MVAAQKQDRTESPEIKRHIHDNLCQSDTHDNLCQSMTLMTSYDIHDKLC